MAARSSPARQTATRNAPPLRDPVKLPLPFDPPRDPVQLSLPFDPPPCPRCGQSDAPIEYDTDTNTFICTACAATWCAVPDMSDMPDAYGR